MLSGVVMFKERIKIMLLYNIYYSFVSRYNSLFIRKFNSHEEGKKGI